MPKANAMVCTVIGATLLALGGCATKTTTADLMREHASEAQAEADLKKRLAKQWETGSELVTSGEKRIKEGEKRVESAQRDLKEGQEDIERGRREIAEGRTLVLESESRFRENFPGTTISVGK